MSTTVPTTGTASQTSPTKPELKSAPNLLFTVVAFAAIIVGAFSAIGGIGGAIYTYRTAAVENITTPDDAAIPEVPVRGPLSMWAQSDIITYHQLDRTGGLRYAEMERQVPQLDEAGEPVLDEAGEPVMVDNAARASWINATALTTVLGLGILSYAFSAFAFVVGLVMVGLGLVVLKLRKVALA
jgi:fatty acid desaturase